MDGNPCPSKDKSGRFAFSSFVFMLCASNLGIVGTKCKKHGEREMPVETLYECLGIYV